MKRIFLVLLVVWMMLFVTIAFAAEAVTPAASQSLFDWLTVNAAIILGAALAVSEALALIPAFQGNGILDTIIKFLKLIMAKKAA